MKKIILSLSVILFLACNKTPETKNTSFDEIPEKGLAVYKSFISLSHSDSSDTAPEALLDSALKINESDIKQFQEFLEYCKNNPREFNDMLSVINEHLNSFND